MVCRNSFDYQKHIKLETFNIKYIWEKMKSKNKILAFTIFLASSFIGGCSSNTKESPVLPVVVQVKTDSVRSGNIEQAVNATGQTSIQKIFQITSPLTGVIVKFKYFNGDIIKKGEDICLIRTKESQAAITGAESILSEAHTTKQKSEAKTALEKARNSSNELKITAPFTGILIKKMKNEGEVTVEGEQIGSLINDASIIFIANVPAASISIIKKGEKVNLKFATSEGKEFSGIIKTIEPSVNVADQTIPVQIQFDGRNKIFEDALFGEASIITNSLPNQLIVPLKAILHDDENNTNSVYLINQDSIAYSVKVDVIQRNDSTAAIYSPMIRHGMPIIVEGSYGLPDSTKVNAVPYVEQAGR